MGPSPLSNNFQSVSLARHIAVRHGGGLSVTTSRWVTNLPNVLQRRRFGHVANTKLCLSVTTCRQWRYFCNYVLAGLDFGSFAGYILKKWRATNNCATNSCLLYVNKCQKLPSPRYCPRRLIRRVHRFLVIYLIVNVLARFLLVCGQVENGFSALFGR